VKSSVPNTIKGGRVPDPVTYRNFTETDIAAAHALTVALKWPHRAEDWRFMFQVGAGFVALDAGEVIGTALYWKYGSDRASLGLIIVSPSRQGEGVGRKLMELVLDELKGRATFLHATPAGEPLYTKLGFRTVGTLVQHQGAAFQPPLIALPTGERLRPLGSSDTPRLVEFASRACGLDRAQVLPALLANAEGIGLERDGELLGFSLFRRFGRGFAIGPIVTPHLADDHDENRAKALITHWLSLNQGTFIRMDTPADSGLSDWLEGIGLHCVDRVSKMVLDAPPGGIVADPALREFGIINQAML
jgi:GNAT superfamily N-acetyltransferase